MSLQQDIEGEEPDGGVLSFATQLALNIALSFELPYRSKRPFRVDPHTGIDAKLLDERINLYQGIAWIISVSPLLKRGDAVPGSAKRRPLAFGKPLNTTRGKGASVRAVWQNRRVAAKRA